MLVGATPVCCRQLLSLRCGPLSVFTVGYSTIVHFFFYANIFFAVAACRFTSHIQQ